MNVLVINSGSSSIKYQIINMQDEKVLCNGLVERIGEEVGNLVYKKAPGTDAEEKIVLEQPIPDHETGMKLVVDLIVDAEKGVIANKSEIDAIGHRIVQGGDIFSEPALVDDSVVAGIEKLIPLGPLHNPGHLAGIRVALELFPGVPQVTVFDTAFHQTIPDYAHVYALPYELYTEHKIRRYGFHGTSHKFVANETAKLIGKPAEECNLITVHLGNGCSMTAVEKGKSVDTSMGLTPLEGLVMGTRCGDMDPAIMPFVAKAKGLTVEELDDLMNKQSGLKGLCGLNDMRDIHAAIEKGDERAKLALGVQTYRNRKYIGAYMAALGHVDAIAFTAGIGENDNIVRSETLRGLEGLGVKLDEEANAKRSGEPMKISTDDSPIQVWVVPTNEELAIARETKEVIEARG